MLRNLPYDQCPRGLAADRQRSQQPTAAASELDAVGASHSSPLAALRPAPACSRDERGV